MGSSKLVYLAGPIDQMGREEPWTIRRRVRECLTHAGATIFDPVAAFAVPDGIEFDNAALYRINMRALSLADGMLALLPRGVPTIGTPIEIDRAIGMGTPVAIVGGEQSFQLAGMLEDESLAARFTEIPEAVQWLKETMSINIAKDWQQYKVPMNVRLDDGARMPTRSFEGDAGFDLYIKDHARIRPGEFVDVPCGVYVEMPHNVWGMLVGRSSTLRKRGLLVNTGIIDQGYRGELFAGVKNLGDQEVLLCPGERVAQLIPLPLQAAYLQPVRVRELQKSDRGEAGFGSTGT